MPDDEKEDFYKALYKHIGKSYPSEKVDILKKTDYFVRLSCRKGQALLTNC